MTTPVVLPGAADYSGLQGIEWEGEKIAKEDLEAIHPRLSELAENADSMLRTGIWDLADIDGAEKIVMLKGFEQFRNGWADAKELNQYVQYLQETKTFQEGLATSAEHRKEEEAGRCMTDHAAKAEQLGLQLAAYQEALFFLQNR